MKLGTMHQLMVVLDILLGAVEDRNVVDDDDEIRVPSRLDLEPSSGNEIVSS